MDESTERRMEEEREQSRHSKRKFKKLIQGSKSKMEQWSHPSKSEPRRKRGVTETPDMDVVIGYNVYPGGVNNPPGGVPIIVINSEPLPEPEEFKHFLGFQGVNESRRVLFRPVPGNNFFYELAKTNAANERIFLVCEPNAGNKLTNLSGQDFSIIFVGRDGKEVLRIRPYAHSKETVSVIYEQQELGRISRHNAVDLSEPSHTIFDKDLKKIFILRRSYQLIPRTSCCINHGNRKVANGYNIFRVKKGATEETEDLSICVGTINQHVVTFFSDVNEELNIVDKTLLFTTLVAIQTKALQPAATSVGHRLSLAFQSSVN